MDKDLEQELTGKGVEIAVRKTRKHPAILLDQATLDGMSVEQLAADGESERLKWEDEAREVMVNFVDQGIRQGQRLIAAKKACMGKHKWGPIRDRIAGNQTAASRYMEMAEFREEIAHCESKSDAFEVIKKLKLERSQKKSASEPAETPAEKPRKERATDREESVAMGGWAIRANTPSTRKEGVSVGKSIHSVGQGTVNAVSYAVSAEPAPVISGDKESEEEAVGCPEAVVVDPPTPVSVAVAATTDVVESVPEKSLLLQMEEILGRMNRRERELAFKTLRSALESQDGVDCLKLLGIEQPKPVEVVREPSEEEAVEKVMKLSKQKKSELVADIIERGDKNMKFAALKPCMDWLIEPGRHKYRAHAVKRLVSNAPPSVCAELVSGASAKIDLLNAIFKGEKKSEISKDLTCALEPIAKKFLDLKRLSSPRGKAPTLDEVIEFSMKQEKKPRYEHSGACVEEFFNYYEANGWVQGKGGIAIKDWTAAFRKWVLSQEGKSLKARAPFRKEIKAYAEELGGDATGQVVSFYDHYSANGWKQGNGNAIVDWKASFRSWVSRDMEGTSPGRKSEPEMYDPTKSFPELA